MPRRSLRDCCNSILGLCGSPRLGRRPRSGGPEPAPEVFAKVTTAIQNPDGTTEQKFAIFDINEANGVLDQPTIEALSEIGLDFSAVGSHEFDDGVDELERMIEEGKLDRAATAK